MSGAAGLGHSIEAGETRGVHRPNQPAEHGSVGAAAGRTCIGRTTWAPGAAGAAGDSGILAVSLTKAESFRPLGRRVCGWCHGSELSV